MPDTDGSPESRDPLPEVVEGNKPEKQSIGVSDRPHHYTVWLASGALLVSAISAIFSGLQWKEAHADRQKPAVQRVLERPRLSYVSAGKVQILASGIGVDSEGRSTPPRDLFYAQVKLTLMNTGRTAATFHACVGRAILVRPVKLTEPKDQKGPVLGSESPPNENGCSASNNGARNLITVLPNEAIEISVMSHEITRNNFRELAERDLTILLLGTVSYEEGSTRC
jgi:hypothetical protein